MRMIDELVTGRPTDQLAEARFDNLPPTSYHTRRRVWAIFECFQVSFLTQLQNYFSLINYVYMGFVAVSRRCG